MTDERDEFTCRKCGASLKNHEAVVKHAREARHHEFKPIKYPTMILSVG
jgi:uncharacterized membrane protein YvbJ